MQHGPTATTFPVLGVHVATALEPVRSAGTTAFKLCGHVLRDVQVTGVVTSVGTPGNMVTAHVDDGSGHAVLTVRWVTGEARRLADTAFRDAACVPKLGDLVRVTGTLREYRGERQVSVTHWETMTDPNEECLDRLLAVQAYAHLAALPPPLSAWAERVGARVTALARTVPGTSQRGVTYAQAWDDAGVRELLAVAGSDDPPEFVLSDTLHALVAAGYLALACPRRGLFVLPTAGAKR
ncbi:hypothetical protein H9P43_008423 [Blastocladiella emersonii ATCC 22665]|nr:hypothetical protein H9P43_008423 [Blastocladiella emersonii ATCC 22665]